MRAFSQTFPFATDPTRDADIRAGIRLVDGAAATIQDPRMRPVGLVATAVLKALAKEEEQGANEAWLDSTLEDSFPASDPFVGKYCN